MPLAARTRRRTAGRAPRPAADRVATSRETGPRRPPAPSPRPTDPWTREPRARSRGRRQPRAGRPVPGARRDRSRQRVPTSTHPSALNTTTIANRGHGERTNSETEAAEAVAPSSTTSPSRARSGRCSHDSRPQNPTGHHSAAASSSEIAPRASPHRHEGRAPGHAVGRRGAVSRRGAVLTRRPAARRRRAWSLSRPAACRGHGPKASR